jgi:hypothetical protein
VPRSGRDAIRPDHADELRALLSQDAPAAFPAHRLQFCLDARKCALEVLARLRDENLVEHGLAEPVVVAQCAANPLRAHR